MTRDTEGLRWTRGYDHPWALASCRSHRECTVQLPLWITLHRAKPPDSWITHWQLHPLFIGLHWLSELANGGYARKCKESEESSQIEAITPETRACRLYKVHASLNKSSPSSTRCESEVSWVIADYAATADFVCGFVLLLLLHLCCTCSVMDAWHDVTGRNGKLAVPRDGRI